MTSSQAAESTTRQGRFSRRIKWLAVAVAIVLVLYTGGWFYVADLLEKQAGQALAAGQTQGVSAACPNLRAKGYPFRIGLFCDALSVDRPANGTSVRAGAFRSAAQVYDPTRLVAELDSPLLLSLPQLPYAIAANWGSLQASAKLASPIPARLSFEAMRLQVAAQGGSGQSVPLAAAEDLQFHMRARDSDADLAFRFDGLALEKILIGDRTLPAVTGLIDLALTNGVAFLASGAENLRGQAGELRSLDVSLGEEGGVVLSGPVSVAENGLLDANLSVVVRNPERLATILAAAFPEAANQITTAFSGFASLAGSDGRTPPLPVIIDAGEVKIGFIPAGRIPPLP